MAQHGAWTLCFDDTTTVRSWRCQAGSTEVGEVLVRVRSRELLDRFWSLTDGVFSLMHQPWAARLRLQIRMVFLQQNCIPTGNITY